MTKIIDIKEIKVNKTEPLVLDSFRYAKYNNTIIHADYCIIYPNCGIYLYKKTKNEPILIWHEDRKFFRVNYVTDKHYHVALSNQDTEDKYNIFSSSLYLIINEKFEANDDVDDDYTSDKEFVINVGDKVLRRDNKTGMGKDEILSDTGQLFLLVLYSGDLLNKYEAEIRKKFEWDVIERINESIVKLRRGSNEVLCYQKELSSFDEEVKKGKWLKEKYYFNDEGKQDKV